MGKLIQFAERQALVDTRTPAEWKKLYKAFHSNFD
jgi:hypothetical protein